MQVSEMMKKYLIKISLLFLLLFLIDQAFGHCMNYVISHINIGGTGRDNYICNAASDDIMIFGSSRAENHYNTQLMTDSLGVSCYNCGESGCGVILNYGRLLMTLERHRPRIILYDVAYGFDIFKVDDNHKYLYRLKPHYNRKGIDSIFTSVDPLEKYKMMSSLYRNNSSFLQNIVVYLTNIATDTGVRGYRPLEGNFNPMKVKATESKDSEKNLEVDSLKLYYIDKFIERTQGINLIFVISPSWYGMGREVIEPIETICQRKGIRLYDFSNSKKYVGNNKFFSDGQHLNSYGADEFTRDIVKLLKEEYGIKMDI